MHARSLTPSLALSPSPPGPSRQAAAEWRDFVAALPPHPARLSNGRGIVLASDAPDALVSSWIALRTLRYVGSALPVEIWLPHRDLPTGALLEAFQSHGATLRSLEDASADAATCLHPAADGSGFRLLAAALSAYEHVLVLDPERIPVLNPDLLFDLTVYKDTGAVLWKDFWKLSPADFADARVAFGVEDSEVAGWAGGISGSYEGAYSDLDQASTEGQLFDRLEFTWERVRAEQRAIT